jgi:hypothetical protein
MNPNAPPLSPWWLLLPGIPLGIIAIAAAPEVAVPAGIAALAGA